jgi:hypothetical protein
VSDRGLLLVLVGGSVGLSLGAMALHIVALIQTRDWRGQVGHITAKLGWGLVMLPLLKAISSAPRIAASGLTRLFELGVVVASVGFVFLAVDANRANRLLAASAAKKVGLDAVEKTIAVAELPPDPGEEEA